MARDPGLVFRTIPAGIMRRGNLLAAAGAAGPVGEARDVLALAVNVGLLALESAGRGDANAVELCRSAGATLLDAQLSPVGDDAPPAVRELAEGLAGEGIAVGTLAPPRRGKTKPPTKPRPETPAMMGWRTWLESYQLFQRRPYSRTGADGPVMIKLVDLAIETLEQLGRPLGDLEELLTHRWRRFLSDPGEAKSPGGPGFLRENGHGLRWAERGLPVYGTPWDKETAKAREPAVLPPTLPGGKRYKDRPGAP